MKKKLLPLILALVCAFALAACGDLGDLGGGGGTGGGDEPKTIAVEKIELNKTEITLEIDETETLTATVSPDNATDKAVSWSSSSPTVATVDTDGKVTAKAAGSATVTAKTTNDKTATCTVTVNAPAPVSKVTAAEWSKALTEMTNFTYTQKSGDWSITHKLDGNKLEIIESDESDESDGILVRDDETYYMFTLFAGAWQRKVLTAADAEDYGVATAIEEEQQLLQVCKDDFGKFTYADGKYTAATLDKTQTLNGTLKNVVVKFADGKLIEVTFDFYQSDGDGDKIEFELKDVGTTSVTVPTEYTDYDPDKAYKVTAEQWDEIMDGTDNYTITTNLHWNNEVLVSTDKYDGELKFTEESNGGLSAYFNGCTYAYHKYRYDSGSFSEWRVTYSDDPAEIGMLNVVFKGHYDLFSYSDGKYVAYEFPVTMGDVETKFLRVEIAFYEGELQTVFYSTSRTESYLDNVGNTSFEVPAVCPIENNQPISIPVGTTVKELYETHPALTTMFGKWELSMQIDGVWYELSDEQEMPEGTYTCKLVYNGEAPEQPADVTFTLIGTAE